MAVQEFVAPKSLPEAQGIFANDSSASWLAGGTDLLVGIRLGMRDPRRIIDLKQIPELMALDVGEDSILIGAAASAYDILHNSEIGSLCPGLADALDLIGSTQFKGVVPPEAISATPPPPQTAFQRLLLTVQFAEF